MVARELERQGIDDGRTPPRWTFITNHGHVLLAVAADHDARVEDLAARVGISTRAALSILRDLEEAGYLTRTRRGRRTHYELQPHQRLRHPATSAHEVGELLAVFLPPDARA